MKLVIEIPATEWLDDQDLAIVYSELINLVRAVNKAADKTMLRYPQCSAKMVDAPFGELTRGR